MSSSEEMLIKWLDEDLVPHYEDDEEFYKTIKRLNKLLSARYYNEVSDDNNILVVGSFGRKTHTKRTSDHDLLFILDAQTKKRFDNREGNVQSQLLAEVKEVIKATYSTSEIKQDGQVISIALKKGEIELVPVFEKQDNQYYFPNVHVGWEVTNPIQEIKKAEKLELIYPNFSKIARLTRAWKSYMGINLKGIVIDSMLAEFYQKDINIKSTTKIEDDFINFLKYMSGISKNEFTIIGRDSLYENEDLVFVKEAAQQYMHLYAARDDEMEKISIYVTMFGKKFPGYIISDEEQFIEDQFTQEVRFPLSLDAIVEQDGNRTSRLKKFRLVRKFLPGRNGKLIFEVMNSSDLPKNTKYYWKVRNLGEYAHNHNSERGRILKSKTSDKNRLTEYANFTGNHYVEAYAVVEDKVVARGRITVPIK